MASVWGGCQRLGGCQNDGLGQCSSRVETYAVLQVLRSVGMSRLEAVVRRFDAHVENMSEFCAFRASIDASLHTIRCT